MLTSITVALALALGQANTIGSFGAFNPMDGVAVGAKDPNGKMQSFLVDVSGNLKTSATMTPSAGVNDANNSTTTPLAGNGVFTGVATNILGYSSITVLMFSDQNSANTATTGVALEFSTDGVNWDDASIFPFVAGGASPNAGQDFTVGPRGKFFRVVYTNGATPQTTFRLQTYLLPNAIVPDVVDVGTTISPSSHAYTTQSVITGKTTGGGGGYVQVKVTPSGTLTVAPSQGLTPADAYANPTDASDVIGLNLGWNGATWDRLRSSIANGLQVDVTRVQGSVTTSPPANTTATGTITTTQNVPVATNGIGNARIFVSGTWGGTLVFEGSVDGTNFASISVLPVPVTGGASLVTSTTVNGTWEVRAAGLQDVRVRGASVTSGTATVWITASPGTDYVVSQLVSDGIVIQTSTTPLGANGTIATGSIDMLSFVSIIVTLSSNVASAASGMLIESSVDGVAWVTENATTYSAAHTEHFVIGRRSRFMRFTYTNGATPQASFQWQVVGQRVAPEHNSVQLNETLDSDDSGLLTRSVITGQTTGGGGGFVNVKVNPSGTLTVDASNSTGVAVTGATTPSDAFANPTTSVLGFNLLAGFNGTTWDRVRTANTGRLQVDVVTAPSTTVTQGTASSLKGQMQILDTGGTNLGSVKAGSTAAATTDTSIVVQLNPVQPNLTTALNVTAAQATPASLKGQFELLDAAGANLVQVVATDSTAIANGMTALPAVSRATPTATTAGRAESVQVSSTTGALFAGITGAAAGGAIADVQTSGSTARASGVETLPFQAATAVVAGGAAGRATAGVTDNTTGFQIVTLGDATTFTKAGVLANDTTAIGSGVEVQPSVARAAPTAITAGRSEKLQQDTGSGGLYVVGAPTTTGAGFTFASFAVNTAANIKATPGNLYGAAATQSGAAVCWLQFYNTAGSPTCGTSVVFALPVPVSTGVNYTQPSLIPLFNFTTGIGICCSTTPTGGTTCAGTCSGTVYIK